MSKVRRKMMGAAWSSWIAGIVFLAAIVSFGTPAAQAQVVFPPSHNNTNDAGVDLKRGTYTYSHADISTGNGDPKRTPTLIRYHSSEFTSYQGAFGAGTSHNYDIKAYETTEAGQPVVVIQFGFSTVKFTKIGSDYVPQNRDGSTLEKVYNNVGLFWMFKYFQRDGTGIELLQGTPCTTSFGSCYYPLVIRSPKDGDILLDYDAPGGVYRLRSIISNTGRGLFLTYTSSTSLTVQSVTPMNRASDFCSTVCNSLPAGLPSVTYGYTSGRLTSFTDTLNKSTTYTYDASGRLEAVRLPANPETDFSKVLYDANGRVQTQTWNGKSWTYSFTPTSGDITQAEVTDPGTGVTTTHFGALPVPDYVTDAENKTTDFGYDAYNRLTSVTKPDGNSSVFLLDGRGNTTKITEKPNPSVSPAPADRVTDFAFDAACSNQYTCNQPNSMTTAAGTAAAATTDFNYDSVDGKQLKVTSPPATSGANRAQVRYTYTPRQAYVKTSSGNPATVLFRFGVSYFILNPIPLLTEASTCSTSAPDSCVGASDEIKTTYAYGPTTVTLNNLDMTARTFDPSGLNLTWTNTYTSLVGDLETVTDPRAGVTTYTYDTERRVTKITQPNPGSGAPETVFGFDDDGRQTRVARKIGSNWLVSCSIFSSAGLKTVDYGPSETGASTTCPTRGDAVPETGYTYDDVGRLYTSTQLMGPGEGGDRQATTEYYKNGWVKKVTRAVGSTAAQEYAFYTYTGNGVPATMKVQRTDAPSYALTTYTYSGFDELAKLQYPDAANGSVSSSTDFDAFEYDGLGNLAKRILRCAGGTGCPEIGYSYDALRRLVSKDVPEPGRDVAYSYDLLNRMNDAKFQPSTSFDASWTYDKLGRTLTETSQGKTLTYSYDAAGAWDRIQWPGTGLDLKRDYDVLGRMSVIKPNAGGSNIAAYSWDQLSRRTGISYLNGVTTSYSYDNRSWLSQLKHNLAGTAYDVQWDFADEVVSGATLKGYNRAGQISRARRDNDAYAWTNNYNVNRSYQSNALDQYTRAGSWAATSDPRGNLASYDGWTYTHDAENRLTDASNAQTSATMTYDAIGRLAQTMIGGATTSLLYSGDSLVAEYDGSGTLLRRYVPGPAVDEPAVQYEGGDASQPRYLHADKLGSGVTASDASGAGQYANAYGPYGEPGLTIAGRFGYTGQQWLTALGLSYYKLRFYSPKLGRFLEVDPIGYQDGNNIYRYVASDPINNVDPRGLQGVSDLELGSITSGIGFDPLYDFSRGLDSGSYWDGGLNPDNISEKSGSYRNNLGEIVVTATRNQRIFGEYPAGFELEQIKWAADQAYASNPATLATYFTPLGWLRGIRIHVQFAANVRTLGPMFHSEVSYRGGFVVPYGTAGSIRADAVYGPINNPYFAVELKSGFAFPSLGEINAYRANLPIGTSLYGILESLGPRR